MISELQFEVLFKKALKEWKKCKIFKKKIDYRDKQIRHRMYVTLEKHESKYFGNTYEILMRNRTLRDIWSYC